MSARVSRRAVLLLAAFLVTLYFCIILAVLSPGAAARGGSWAGPRDWPARRPPVDWCRGLRWAPAAGGAPGVALASHPGSGNTWLRYLLQQATGVVTGSIYLDHSLRSHGFPAENVTDGSVLVVKTHEAPPPDPPARFRAAVLLVRHPREAILADFNRLHKGHVGTAPRRAFAARADRLDWAAHVARQTRDWERFHRQWLLRFPHPLHLLRYEELVRRPRAALRPLLRFLNATVSEDAMDCTIARKEGIYRRKKRHNFDPFTREMNTSVERARARVFALLDARARAHVEGGLSARLSPARESSAPARGET